MWKTVEQPAMPASTCQATTVRSGGLLLGTVSLMCTPTPANTTLKRVMYLSKASRRMTRGELMDLLAGARERNMTFGITGLLLYDSGNFAQVLEGPADRIERLLANIARDPRHTDYLLLGEADVEARYFPDWAMDSANLQTFSDDAHRALRRYMADHSLAARGTIYRALRLFVQKHAAGR
jgi:hypothetical protein